MSFDKAYYGITPVATVSKHICVDMEPRGWDGASRQRNTLDSGERLPLPPLSKAVWDNATQYKVTPKNSKWCHMTQICASQSAYTRRYKLVT